jgi:hypothetical protein
MLKSSIISLLSFCFFSNSFSQGPAIEWQHSFEGSGSDFLNWIQKTSDGGSIFTGWSQSNNGDILGNHGDGDAVVIKLDSDGLLDWQACYGGSNFDEALNIIQTPDGGYIFSGYTKSTDLNASGHVDLNYEDAWLVKINASGVIQWQKCYGGSLVDRFNNIQTTPDGGYIAIGISGSTDGDVSQNHGGSDYWLVKLDATGNIQWEKCFGGLNYDEGHRVKVTADGGYIVSGDSFSNDGDITNQHSSNNAADYWVLKLSSSGSIQWQNCYGGSNYDKLCLAEQTPDGGYIIGGATMSSDFQVDSAYGSYDFWALKTDPNGNIQWNKTIGTSFMEVPWDLQVTNDGGVVMSGYYIDPNSNLLNADMNIVKLDSNGNLQWQKILPSIGYEVCQSIKQTDDHGYILGGYQFNTTTGADRLSIIKLEGEGAGLYSKELSHSFSVSPNPSPGKFTIYSEKQEPISSLEIFDLQGKLICSMNNSMLQQHVIDLSLAVPGIYFIHLESNEKKQVLKVEIQAY